MSEAPVHECFCSEPLSSLCKAQESSTEHGGHHLNDFEDFRNKKGSSQGQKLALTGVVSSLDNGNKEDRSTLPARKSPYVNWLILCGKSPDR